jgi:hypothetical protein
MSIDTNRILQTMAAAVLTIALTVAAQTPAETASAEASAAPTWHLGPMQLSGYIDGYAAFNDNRPSDQANGQKNDLYNFNDKTNQFSLSAIKFTLNHEPAPWGAHVDLLYGRTDELMNGTAGADKLKYVEQLFLSAKPRPAKGLELDLGKFTSSAGAEVIESKDNWNYSRSLLFVCAVPYFHFGLRSSIPVTKTETVGVQVVNGWSNITGSEGGATVGLTSAYVKPKYTWNANFYTGPEKTGAQKGYRNLIDTTLLLTPNAKFNAYINYDFGRNRDSITAGKGDDRLLRWQGIAFAAREQLTAKTAVASRIEYYDDPQGFTSGAVQQVKEFTATGEYKWPKGLLGRLEFRRDWSNINFFTKANRTLAVKDQSTVTAGVVAFFGPNR